jgi:hypothetical protein
MPAMHPVLVEIGLDLLEIQQEVIPEDLRLVKGYETVILGSRRFEREDDEKGAQKEDQEDDAEPDKDPVLQRGLPALLRGGGTPVSQERLNRFGKKRNINL